MPILFLFPLTITADGNAGRAVIVMRVGRCRRARIWGRGKQVDIVSVQLSVAQGPRGHDGWTGGGHDSRTSRTGKVHL